MKKIFLFTAVLIFIYTEHSFAQKESRKVEPFSKVSLGIAANLYITQGSKTTLELQGDKDDIENIVTEVKNSTLIIKHERSWWNWRSGHIDIYISTPDISAISVGGSGKVRGDKQIISEDLKLKVSGSGQIILDLEVDRVSVAISGSGKINLSGKADDMELAISGSGNLEADDLISRRYTVKISGSGGCRIHVEDALEAKISGSGNVRYSGDPGKVVSNVSGSGKVRKN